MGKFIDRTVLTALLAGALYLFFASAFHSIPLAAASAFLALALLRKLSHALPPNPRGRRDAKRASERAALEEMACRDEKEARERMRNALDSAYPGQMKNVSLELVLRHPNGMRVGADEVFALWKRHRGEKNLLVASLPDADIRSRELALRLDNPSVRLMDGTQIAALLPSPAAPCTKGGRKHLLRALCREGAPKCALPGAALCLLYLFTGALTHLITGLILLFVAIISGKRPPARLFD